MEEVAEAARCLGVHLNSAGEGDMKPPSKKPPKIHPSVLQQVRKVAAMAKIATSTVEMKQDDAKEDTEAVAVKVENGELGGLRKVSLEERHSCPICHDAFKAKIYLRRHRKRKHTGQTDETPAESINGFDRFKCSLCPKTFKNKKSLPKHRRKMHPGLKQRKVPPIPNCPFCEQTFSTRKLLRVHKVSKHPGMVNEGELSCSYCPGVFKGGFLEVHIKYKHPEKYTGTIKKTSSVS